MKQRNLFYGLLACTLLLVGCSREEEGTRLRASIERFARDSKVGINAYESSDPRWSNILPVFTDNEPININGQPYSMVWDGDYEAFFVTPDVPQPGPGDWYIAQTPMNFITENYSGYSPLTEEGDFSFRLNYPTEYHMRPLDNSHYYPSGGSYNVYYDNLPLIAMDRRESGSLYFRNFTIIINVKLNHNLGAYDVILEEVAVPNCYPEREYHFYTDNNTHSFSSYTAGTSETIHVYPPASGNAIGTSQPLSVMVPLPPTANAKDDPDPPTIRIEVKGKATEWSTGKVYRFTYAMQRVLNQHLVRNQYFTAPMTVDRNSNMVEWTQVGGPINPGTGNHEGFSNGGSLWN